MIQDSRTSNQFLNSSTVRYFCRKFILLCIIRRSNEMLLSSKYIALAIGWNLHILVLFSSLFSPVSVPVPLKTHVIYFFDKMLLVKQFVKLFRFRCEREREREHWNATDHNDHNLSILQNNQFVVVSLFTSFRWWIQTLKQCLKPFHACRNLKWSRPTHFLCWINLFISILH